MSDRLNIDERSLRAEIDRLRAGAAADPSRDGHLLGAALIALGVTLQRAGRRDEAFEALQEGTALQRRLIPDDPARARPLLHLAWLLNERGDLAAALHLADEVIGLLERASPAAPPSSDLLAEAHFLRSGCLLGQNRLLEAEQASRMAAQHDSLDQRLSARPLLSLATEATYTCRLAEILNRQGRGVDALPFARRAWDLAETLVREGPPLLWERYRLDAANQLTFALRGAGHWDEAIARYQAEIEYDRARALDHPDDALPRLAHNWTGLSVCLLEGRQDPEAAEAALRESVRIYKRLAERQADRYGGDLHQALLNLYRLLVHAPSARTSPVERQRRASEARWILGELKARSQTVEGPDRDAVHQQIRAEIAAYCRRLISAARHRQPTPTLQAPRSAGALIDLSRHLERFAVTTYQGPTDRPAAIAAASAEVVRLRALARSGSPRAEQELAHALDHLGRLYRDDGQLAASQQCLGESLDSFRRRRQRDEVARVSLELADLLADQGQSALALRFADEALAALADLETDHPEQVAALRGAGLFTRFRCLIQLDQALVAEEAIRSALQAYGLAANFAPPGQQYAFTRSTILLDLGCFLRQHGRDVDAIAVLREAFGQLQTVPTAFSGDLLRCLRAEVILQLSSALERSGAPEHLAEAVHLHEGQIRSCRQWLVRQPRVAEPLLALHLGSLGRCLLRLDRPAVAIPPLREAAAIYRRLLADHAGSHLALVETLRQLRAALALQQARAPRLEAAIIAREMKQIASEIRRNRRLSG